MRSRFSLAAPALIVAAAAIIWGIALVVDPSGKAIGLSEADLVHAPFDTFLVPGLVLSLAVGGSHLAAALAHLLRRVAAPLFTIAAGLVLVAWIAVQIVMLWEFHWLQGLLLAIAALELGLAARALGRDEARPADREPLAFLKHRRLALVGLSPKPRAFSATIAQAMRDQGYDVVAINRRTAGEGGYYATVAELSDPPRAALLMVSPDNAMEAVQDCVKAGVKSVWFHHGVGPASESPQAVDLALRSGMQVVRDACPMMYMEPVGWMHRAHRNLEPRRSRLQVA